MREGSASGYSDDFGQTAALIGIPLIAGVAIGAALNDRHDRWDHGYWHRHRHWGRSGWRGIARIGVADTEAMARAPISDRTAAMVRTADKTAKALQEPLAKRKMNGDPGRIRTCDHRLRRPVLYPTELRDPAL